MPPTMKPLTLRVPKDLLRKSTHRLLMMVYLELFPIGADAAVMVIVV